MRGEAKSSRGNANCVEVAVNFPGVVTVRDSKDPEGSVLEVSTADWRTFLAGLAR